MSSRAQRRLAWLRNVLLACTLLAASETTLAQVTITEVTTHDLGTLLGGASGRNFILNTDETVSGTDSGDYLFGAVTGQLDILGVNKQVNIVADNFSTTGGVSINAVPCKFHTDAQTTCDGSGINVRINRTQTRILYIGIDLDTSQVHSGGDSPTATYDINVTIL